jgi:hypothetical protein
MDHWTDVIRPCQVCGHPGTSLAAGGEVSFCGRHAKCFVPGGSGVLRQVISRSKGTDLRGYVQWRLPLACGHTAILKAGDRSRVNRMRCAKCPPSIVPVATQRNKEIWEFSKTGVTRREVCLRFGISRQRVAQVIKRMNNLTKNEEPRPTSVPSTDVQIGALD